MNVDASSWRLSSGRFFLEIVFGASIILEFVHLDVVDGASGRLMSSPWDDEVRISRRLAKFGV